MAVDRRTLPAFLSGDTDFRTWAQGIDTQIKALGIVQTSDTGQVDLTTAARPALSSYAGYRIYRFDDSLQATKPCFIKLEYGAGGAVDRPALRAQIATGTNGAGTLTGQVGSTTGLVLPTASATAGVVNDSCCSGNTSRLSLATNLHVSTATHGFALMVERTVDPDGTPNGNGLIYYSLTSNALVFYALPFTGVVPAAVTAAPWQPVINAGQQSSDGGNVGLWPLPVGVAGRVQLATFLAYAQADLGKLTAVTVTHLGSSRSVMPLGSSLTSGTGMGNASLSLATLWE